MGKQRLLLIIKMARQRSCDAFFSALLALALVLVAATLLGFISAYQHAVKRGVESSFGSYTLQVTGNEKVSAYLEDLQQTGAAVAIYHTQANLLSPSNDRAGVADVTFTSGAANLGVLIAGEFPSHPGELSLSSEIAKQLELGVGDSVSLVDTQALHNHAEYVVVGINENPGSVKELSAVAITDDAEVLSLADSWLTNDSLAEIDSELTHGGGSVANVSAASRRAGANAASYQPIPPQIAWFFGILLLFSAVAAIYGSDHLRRREIYRILIAIGDKPWKATTTTCAQTMLIALAGGFIGWGLSALSTKLFANPVATHFEQRWDAVEWESINSTALAVIVSIAVGGLITAWTTVFFYKHKQNHKPQNDYFPKKLLFGLSIVGTILTLLFIISRQLYSFPYGQYVAMILGAFSIPNLAYSIRPGARNYRVTSMLANRMQKLVLAGMSAVFVLNYYGALYASSVAVLSNWTQNQISGETSYLSIVNANKNAVDNLLRRFPDLKTRMAIFGEVATKDEMFRIVDPKSIGCINAASNVDECPTAYLDLVSVASGGLLDSGYINHAPNRYVSADGKTTLIGISITDSNISRRLIVDNIIADDRLQNNVLSGLVLAPISPTLEQLGVETPYSYTIIIFGFGNLDAEDQNTIRSTILTEAPFALLVDPDEPEMRQLKAQALARQLFAILVSGAVLIALTTTLVSDQKAERQLIHLSGGRRLIRLRLIKPLIYGYILTLSAAIVLGRLSAMDHIPFTPVPITHDYGLLWSITFAGLAFVAPAIHIGTRSPDVAKA